MEKGGPQYLVLSDTTGIVMCSHNCIAPSKCLLETAGIVVQLLGHAWPKDILFACPSAFSASQAAAHALCFVAARQCYCTHHHDASQFA